MNKIYVLYDARAKAADNTDDAIALDTATKKPHYNPDENIWAEYDLVDDEATNEHIMWELPVKKLEA